MLHYLNEVSEDRLLQPDIQLLQHDGHVLDGGGEVSKIRGCGLLSLLLIGTLTVLMGNAAALFWTRTNIPPCYDDTTVDMQWLFIQWPTKNVDNFQNIQGREA